MDDKKQIIRETDDMDKNKVKLSDELLDKVSGGGPRDEIGYFDAAPDLDDDPGEFPY